MKNSKKNSKKLFYTENKELVGCLSTVNWNLDVVRNGLFNIASSVHYVRDLKVPCSLVDTLDKNVKEIEKSLNEIISSLNIKFGEKLPKDNDIK